MSNHVPSLLVVEDHPEMGKMLVRFLREQGQMEVWALVRKAEVALEKLAAVERDDYPTLALVDVSLPDMSGIILLTELMRLYPQLPCLMLSAHRDRKYVQKALDSGALGYVAKDDLYSIIDAVHKVLAGEIYLSESISRAMND